MSADDWRTLAIAALAIAALFGALFVVAGIAYSDLARDLREAHANVRALLEVAVPYVPTDTPEYDRAVVEQMAADLVDDEQVWDELDDWTTW